MVVAHKESATSFVIINPATGNEVTTYAGHTDSEVEAILQSARSIAAKEVRQAEKISSGEKLSAQLKFQEYLARRKTDPNYTFRQHLREIGGAIEE